MPIYEPNFTQMAAMMGLMGNPALGMNPLGMLGGMGGNAADVLGNVAGTALKGVEGALGGLGGVVKGLEDALGIGGQQQQPQQPQHPHHHHHHHHQGGQSPMQQEIQKLEAEMKHLADDLKHLEGGGQQGPYGPGGGMGQGQQNMDPGFNPWGQGGGMGQGQGMDPGFNPAGQGGGMGGMNPFGPDFGAMLGNGLPFGSGFGDPMQESPWTVTNTGAGKDHIDLGNYTLDLNEQNMQWTLTNKKTGDKTDISGDPHVHEGGNKWDFKKDLSFQLDDGTRITVHTIPYGNGQTVSSELDITKGSHGMKVTGLGGNLDGGLTVSDGLNGYALDAANAGAPEIYEAAGNWQLFDGTNINQQIATQDNL